jgi:outer membrane protein
MNSLKKIILASFFLLGLIGSSVAQKYAFVDTKYILDNMPAYKEAQKKLDDVADKWQKEIEGKLEEIVEKNKKLQQELILLPADEKVKKQAEIKELEEAVKELQKKRFGVNGDLLKKRRELIEPIQDEIYKAIKALAKEKGYDFIMDKATNSNILFTNPKYDKSEQLLKKIKQ